METAVAALIIITVMLFGVLTLGQGYLATQEAMMQSWQAVEAQAAERARTDVVVTAAHCLPAGDVVELMVRNAGSTKLADLAHWDVLLQYSAAGGPVARWYPYAGTALPPVNQWGVQGIYQDAALAVAEVYGPGILDPGEEMVVHIRVSPPMAAGSMALAVVSTPNGVGSSRAFTP